MGKELSFDGWEDFEHLFDTDDNCPCDDCLEERLNQMSEFDELADQLEGAAEAEARKNRNSKGGAIPQSPFQQMAMVNWGQWSVDVNDSFMACGGTVKKLPPGVYKVQISQRGIHFIRVNVMTDDIINFEDTTSDEVIEGIKKFWQAKDAFVERGILYKRGVLLWGPPGSGKTVTVSLLMRELVKNDGVVFLADHPGAISAALMQMRRIEPDRNLIVVLEDIEEIIQRHGEHEILALLDGENQIANVVHIATTNYPAQLGARIVNRPSRFDEVRKIGMPNERSREIYFKHVLGETLDAPTLATWVKDTDGMSVAHLRELVVATQCLNRTYEETVERLKKMMVKPREDGGEGFRAGKGVGFGSAPEKISV